MAYADGVLTYEDATGVSRAIKVRVNGSAPLDFLPAGLLVNEDGLILGKDATPLPVRIVADTAGTLADTDDGTVAAGQTPLALAIMLSHGFNGTAWSRLRAWAASVGGGALGVSEAASTGTCTTTIVTVNSATANGTQLIAANSTGTRRRVLISQRGTTQVEVYPGNITASTGKGRPLAGVIGVELPYFIAGELRATCASGTQEVAVTEELNAA